MIEPYGWKEFKTREIFDICKISSYNKNSLDVLSEHRDYDYITRTAFNRGVCSTTGYIGENGLNKAGTYSLGLISMDFFYREKDWYAGQFMRKIVCKLPISFKVALYFETILNGLSEYLQSGLVRDIDNMFLNAVLLLPVTSTGGLAFGYMEEYISMLETEYISNLETRCASEVKAYLGAVGLEDYSLTDEDQDILTLINSGKEKFAEFQIEELFEKIDLKKKSGFNKSKDTSAIRTDEFNIPLVNAKHGDNGIMFYGRGSECASSEGTIGIVQNGAIATGDVYPHPEKTGILWDAYLIKPRLETTKEVLFYFSCALEKTIKLRFSYDDKATWDKVKKVDIFLPVTSNGNPDYNFMEHYIRAIEKQIIGQLYEFRNKEIEITKRVINER